MGLYENNKFQLVEQLNRKKAEILPSAFLCLCFELFAEISFQQTLERTAVSSFVTKTLENAVKTGIFNRLAQNKHKIIKIYAVDFSS